MIDEMHKKEALVVISILNWMNFTDTINCIHSLLHLNYSNIKLLVRDNNSPNHSYAQLSETFPNLTIYSSKNNLGYAYGHYENFLLAKELKADFFWILNSDLEVEPNALSELLKAYSVKGEAIYGSVSLDPIEKDQIDFGGAQFTELSNESLSYNEWKGKSYAQLIEQHPNGYEVESVEGSSMLLPMTLIEKYGFLKTDFFMYAEETDYCYRLRKKGISSFLVTTSVVKHHNEGSTNFSPRLKVITSYYRRRNALRFSLEHLGLSRMEALGYQNGTLQNLKAIAKGLFSREKDLTYFYALACFHAFLGTKGKKVDPERFI